MKAGSFQIDSVKQYQQVKKTISRKQQPGKVMRFLMNALESYRQSRKLGWSRPWNKYHLTVFQSFKLKLAVDQELFNHARQLLENDVAMPSSALHFVKDLLADGQLMGFLFVHDYQDPEEQQLYEGVTLSLGRIKDKKYRDRIDLIFESPVIDGVSQGLSRVRVYIDPFMGAKEPLWHYTLTDNLDSAYLCFEQLGACSWDWADDDKKLWNHWTENYINYFGPRKQLLSQSYLCQPAQPESRILNKAEQAA